jgi:hypothetical protein
MVLLGVPASCSLLSKDVRSEHHLCCLHELSVDGTSLKYLTLYLIGLDQREYMLAFGGAVATFDRCLSQEEPTSTFVD